MRVSLRVLAVLCLGTMALVAQPMVGTYTVVPSVPTGGTNFASLTDAVNALVANGVAGPVTIELYGVAGPYTAPMPFVTGNLYTPSNAVLVLAQWPGASAANRVTFKPAAGENVVFDATGLAMGVFWNGADYATIEGIEIRNALFDGVSLHSETQNGQVLDAVIERCLIHSCGAAGVVVYGNSLRPQNTLIRNNIFYNLQRTNAGIFNSLARFGYVSGRRHDFTRVIHNTFIVDSGVGSAFAVIGDMPSGGTTGHFAEISNNIFVRAANVTGPIYAFPVNGTSNGLPGIMDSNVYDLRGTGAFSTGSTPTPDLATWQTTALLDAGSFAANPLFVNEAGRDYHLTGASPCVDASSLPTLTSFDFDGEPRGAMADIGADEFVPACTIPQFQVNNARVGMTVNGVLGSICTRAISFVPATSAATLSVQNANAGLGWEIVIGFSPLLARGQGALITAQGQMVNVNLLAPVVLYLNGGTLPNFGVPSPGSFTTTYAPGVPGLVYGAQMIALDPTSPEGFYLSQGVQVEVL